MGPRTLVTVWLGLALFVSGCVSSGNPSVMDRARLDQIVIDVSTKDDVKRLLGQPNGRAQQSGSVAIVPGYAPVPGLTNSETWTYSHLSVDVDGATFIPIVGLFAGGATSHLNTFTVVFDQAGIVRHISSSQNGGALRAGSGERTTKRILEEEIGRIRCEQCEGRYIRNGIHDNVM